MTAHLSQEALLKQINFYFSDGNIYHSKFMQAELPKNNGCVFHRLISSAYFVVLPIESLLTFPKLAGVTKDELIKIASLSTEVCFNHDKTMLGRTRPLPAYNHSQIIRNTIFVVCSDWWLLLTFLSPISHWPNAIRRFWSQNSRFMVKLVFFLFQRTGVLILHVLKVRHLLNTRTNNQQQMLLNTRNTPLFQSTVTNCFLQASLMF